MKLYLTESFGKDFWTTRQQTISFSMDKGTEDAVINLYPQIKEQSMEGFGGAITDAAGYVFSRMSEEKQEEMLSLYFSPEQMNYQKVRIHMDSCDFSTHMYEAVEAGDESLASFSFRDTERYILPLLDAAEKKAGKRLKIMLSVWSPPAWMKTNGSRKNGGSLKPEYRKLWAKYICRYIHTFRERGYQVERISIQNEPKAVQTWDSCVYTTEQEKEFLRDFLYPEMKKEDLSDVEIFIWDHNKERLFERVEGIVDEETDSMVAGAAFHWYSGDHFEALDLVRKRYPGKKLILSESCLEYNKFDKGAENKNAARLAHDMIGNLNHGLCAFYDWNILLDVQGGPNHVGNFCDAPFLYDEKKDELIARRTSQYYWHFAHFIQPGAVRIAHTCYTGELDVTAWENPDGRRVIILLNATEKEKTCVLRMDGQEVTFSAEGNGIASGVIEMA